MPIILSGQEPPLSALPELMLNLAHDVDWEEEKACLMGVSDALAAAYAGRLSAAPAFRTGAPDALVQV